MIYKVLDYFYNKYIQLQEERIQKQFGKLGSNSFVYYPSLQNKPCNIFIGDNVTICKDSRLQIVGKHNNEEARIIIGSGSYIAFRCSMIAGEDIVIGDNVLLGSDVTVVSHNHGINPEQNLPYMSQELATESIHIGNNVWIGDKVVITAGVRIGEGSVVGAGAIVTKNIPDYSIAVGNPAIVIKKYDFEMHRWVRV